MTRVLLTRLCLICAACASTSIAADNWPGFRGPSGQGDTTAKDLPTSWSATSNVAWKTPIPGGGWSSPIVHGDRVFLTSAMDENRSCRVICLSRKGGEILWNKEVFRQVPSQKQRENSYATPTPVTDGTLVYAVFADGSIVALDFKGNVAWTNREAEFYSHHGLGSSPILYRDLLIMTFDGSAKTGEPRLGWQLPWDKSYVIALDKRTGKQRWKTFRGTSRIAHLTPSVLREKGRKDLILSAAGDVVQAFDPDDGRIVWTFDSKGEGVVPSPVIGDGMVFTISGFMKHTIRTVRTGGSGNITKSHVAWEDSKTVPRIPSMVYRKPYLYSITDRGGIATCRVAKTGEVVWRERVGGSFYPSPIICDDKIYFLSRDGETVLLRTGPKFEVLGRNSIGEPCQASPAVYGNQLFIRTERNLFCVGKAGA
jgi:outer membrane protein assembly factor BamB